MNSDRADQPATPENPPQRGVPGQALAAQREAMGWSVEQVADQLKMAVRQVVALEAGDYSALPSPAVTRGFVRAYAKILRLDPAPLVAMIEMDTPAPVETVARTRGLDKPARFNESSRFPLHGKRSSLPLGWIAGAVVVVVAAAAAWHFGLFPHHKEEAASGTTVAAPASAPQGVTEQPLHNPDVPLISVPGQPGAEPQNGTQPPASGSPANGTAAPATGTPPAAPAGAPGAAAAPAPAQPAAAPAPVQAAAETAAPAGALVLKINEDSWIQVRTADGKNLVSRLVKAGDHQSLPVDQPVTLTVGNPKGVIATLRGAVLELPLLPGKTIARVALK